MSTAYPRCVLSGRDSGGTQSAGPPMRQPPRDIRKCTHADVTFYNMKKTLFIAVAAMMMASCNNSPKVERTVEELNTWNESFVEEVQNKLAEMDSTLAEDVKEEKMIAYNDEAFEKYAAHLKAVLFENKGNEVSMEAFKMIYSALDESELDDALALLEGEYGSDQMVQAIKANLAAKKATAEGQKFTDFEVAQNPEKPEELTKFSEYVGNGKYVLVDFWASWCGPCKREIPNIKSVYEKYHGDNFDVLSVAVWDDPKASVDTAAAYGVNWNHIVNAQRIPTEIYGIQGIPHIILVGPDGTILKRDLRGDDIEKAVAECLK